MTKEEFLAMAAQRYEALKALDNEADFYEFEKKFDQTWTELGREVVERTIGEAPKNHRKKTKSKADTGKSK